MSARSALAGADRATEARVRWARIGRIAGYATASAFVVGTLLYLLDAVNAFGAPPEFHRTAAGALQDEANFWVAYFAHQHHLVWDIVARDTLLPVAFVALIVLGLALRNTTDRDGPDGQLMVVFLAVGGVLAAIADLTYLAATDYWRLSGWTAHPAERMVAVGRSTQAIDALSRWPESAGFVIVAGGLWFLARVCRASAGPSRWVSTTALVAAPLLVVIAVAGIVPWQGVYDWLSLILGVFLAPAIAVGLARWFGLRSGATLVDVS